MRRGILRSLLGAEPTRKSRAADLRILHADSNDPDTIAIEAWDDDDMVFEIVTDAQGARTLWVGAREFDRDEFLALLTRCAQEIDSWDSKLRAPGAVWENEEKKAP